MKKYLVFIILFFTFIHTANASGLTISSPVYNDGNKTVSFTIKWDNSWKISSGPTNYDGAWLFIKRQACSGLNIWATALISTTSADHLTSVASGNNLLTVDAVNDGMGVFIRRTNSGLGNIGLHTVTLKLNSSMTTSPIITPTASDNFKVFGIEMVYVPQGQFYLGDGRPTNTNNFSLGTNTSSPILITGGIQSAGLGAASVYTSNLIYGCPNILPPSFPLGYNGFWCMKYETSNLSYLDFLNSLTYDQQYVRLSKWGGRYPNSINVNFTNSTAYKGTMTISVAGTFNTVPATFTTNLTYSSYSPMGWLSWNDLTAYLDWTGLRPMTEFEYEKTCRGPLNPIAYEYPWGSTALYQVNGSMSNAGGYNEYWNNTQEGQCAYQWNDNNWAPYRSGLFATATSNRSQSGATYYGILDMGGNLEEQVVGGGSLYDFSNFTTANGDGALGSDGNANTLGWPSSQAQGNYIKGGDYQGIGSYPSIIQVSDRQFLQGTTYSNGTDNGVGGRGVRSFPN